MADASTAAATAEQVASILKAAEQTAARLLEEAREQAARIVESAEAEAHEILGDATNKGLVMVADAERAADQVHREATIKARELLRDARQTAEAVRTEGVTLSENLREMGSSLRVNAEKLLGDVQSIHARLRADVDRVEGTARKGRTEETEPPSERPAPRRPPDDELDVPEFLPGD